jgi:hypothetical protein
MSNKKLPGVFTEIAKHRRVEPHERVSFKDLKIDFNQLLGQGMFGYVYNLIPRPHNEKGFLSQWFPIPYDYLFRSKNKTKSSECVKILKPSPWTLISIALCSLIPPPIALLFAVKSFFARREEASTNNLLRKYGLSKIAFKDVDYSVYSQVKTKVEGYTFSQLCKNKAFVDPNNYEMRKSFVEFLWTLKNTPLNFNDLHQYNVMYDRVREEWEIVDGSAWETQERSLSEGDEHLKQLRARLLALCPLDHKSKQVIDTLTIFALHNRSYKKQDDLILLQKVSSSVDDITVLYKLRVRSSTKTQPPANISPYQTMDSDYARRRIKFR